MRKLKCQHPHIINITVARALLVKGGERAQPAGRIPFAVAPTVNPSVRLSLTLPFDREAQRTGKRKRFFVKI
jgi:hypothetical protein